MVTTVLNPAVDSILIVINLLNTSVLAQIMEVFTVTVLLYVPPNINLLALATLAELIILNYKSLEVPGPRGQGGFQKLKIYAVNYNVLRVQSGMGGLAYSN